MTEEMIAAYRMVIEHVTKETEDAYHALMAVEEGQTILEEQRNNRYVALVTTRFQLIKVLKRANVPVDY